MQSYNTICYLDEKKIFINYYLWNIYYSNTLKYSQNIISSQMVCGISTADSPPLPKCPGVQNQD